MVSLKFKRDGSVKGSVEQTAVLGAGALPAASGGKRIGTIAGSIQVTVTITSLV